MHHSKLRRKFAPAALLLATLGQPFDAHAIDIQIAFNGAASATPSYDPTGGLMLSLFGYAEQYYEDIFEDTGAGTTLTLNVWYENLDPISTGILGRHDLLTQNASRQTSGNIRIDTDRTWFIDSTPGNDSEFAMQQTLFRELSTNQQNNGFNSTVVLPNLEVGYGGAAAAGAPNNAQNGYDMLTVVLREVGHALGVDDANLTVITETGDGDYDLNLFHTGNTPVGVNAGSNIGLLQPSTALMGPTVPTGTRKRPSHLDLYAMAVGNNYSNLDVPRREGYTPGFGVYSDWNDGSSWSGGAAPDSNDDATVRNAYPQAGANLLELSANAVARNLEVREAGGVSVRSYTLAVTNKITVTDPGSLLSVEATGEVQASVLDVANEGAVLSSGVIDVGTLSILDSGRVSAATISIASTLVNNGDLGTLGAPLIINAAGGAVINLDGVRTGTLGIETGKVTALTYDASINGPLSDSFNGTLLIGRTTTFSHPWTLGGTDAGTFVTSGSGQLILDNGSSALTAVLAGAAVEVKDSIQVRTGRNARIDAVTTFQPGSSTVIESGGLLTLNAASTLNGGSFSGSGGLSIDAPTTVNGDVLMNTLSIDLDGDGASPSPVTVNNGGTLTLSDTPFGSGMTDAYSGTLTLRGALVSNQSSFRANGTIVLSSGTLESIMASGALDLGGADVSTVTNSNASRIIGGLVTGPQTQFTINSGSSLRLLGATTGTITLNGGTFTGGGTLTLGDSFIRVEADTYFSNSFINLDGDTNGAGRIFVNQGARLIIDGQVTDTPASRIDLYGGTLLLNGSAGMTTAGDINLTNINAAARINGSQITVSGVLGSFGAGLNLVNAALKMPSGTLLTNSQLNLNGTFSVLSGTVTKTGISTLRVAGTQAHAGGTLNVSSGTVIFETDAGAGTSLLNLVQNAGAVIFNSNQKLSSLTINSGTTLLTAAGNRVLNTRSLAIAGTGRLDLTDNDVIIDYTAASPLATIRGYLVAGRNGGNWLGNGITSSAAAANSAAGLAIAEANTIGSPATFFGQSIDSTTLLIRYTLYGDADLSGGVNLDDFTRLAASFGLSSTWSGGDFNYDNLTNLDDFTALAANFGLNLPVDQPRGPTVPEPAALWVVAVWVAFGRRGR